MPWDFETEPEFEEKLAWMRTFVRDEIWPLEVISEELGEERFWRHARSLQAEVKRRGLWATHLPPELGGQGYGQVKLALMHEIEGSSWWAPYIFGNQAPDSGNSEIIALFGTPEQKERWLYPLLAGGIRSAFSMTEPESAGSDPTLMRSRAELRDGEWVINGHKWYSSNGMIADILVVMAVTDPDADRHHRASMILVPSDTPGVRRVRNVPTLAGHEPFGQGSAEIYYEDVHVPAANILGKRGQGFEIAQARLGPGRIHHCMRWLGQSKRALDILCERALQREAFGGTLAQKQTVQSWIADSVAERQAARLLTLHAAWTIDRYGPSAARREISIIKFFGAKVLHDVIDRAIQVNGGLGFSSDLPLEGMYRWARAARLIDGADEVHRLTVARSVLREYERPAGDFPTDHIPTRRAAAQRKFAHLLELATANS